MNRCRHLDLESLIETIFNLIIWSSAWGKPILSLRFVLSFLTVVTQATYASGIMSDSTRGWPTSSKNAETMLGHGQSWSGHPSGHSCWFSAGLNGLVCSREKGSHTHTHAHLMSWERSFKWSQLSPCYPRGFCGFIYDIPSVLTEIPWRPAIQASTIHPSFCVEISFTRSSAWCTSRFSGSYIPIFV